MDTTARKQLLLQKLQANSHRRQREMFLSSIPRALAKVLADAPAICFPEVHEVVVRNYYPITPTGFGRPQRHTPTYCYREVGRTEKAIAAFEEDIFRRYTDPVLLGISTPVEIHFFDDRFLVPDLPLFVIDPFVALRYLPFLWDRRRKFLSLVSQDYSRGIVVDHYVGYLQEDPNLDEIAFGVGTWNEVQSLPKKA